MSLIGRAAERAAMQQAVDDAARGRGRTVIVRGEPGIGKTELLRATRRYAAGAGLMVRSGRATELEQDVPLAGLSAMGLAPADGQPDWQWAQSAADDLRDAAGDRAVALLVDDAHWADPATVDALAILLSRPPRIPAVLMITARPGPVADALVRVATTAPGGCLVMDLGPLDEADSIRLLRDHGVTGDRPDLVMASGGNPLFLRELASHDDESVPTGIVAAVHRELAGLSADAVRLVEAAALLGDPFEVGLAARVAGLPEQRTDDLLAELTAHRFLHPGADLAQFRFRHPVVRSAVLESTDVSRRRTLHRSAAAVLAAGGAPAPSIARHLRPVAEFGDTAAARTLIEAAEQVRHRSPSVAADWYTAALRCDPRLAPGYTQHLITALVQSGRAVEALDRMGDELERLPAGNPDWTDLTLRAAALERLTGLITSSERRLAAVDPTGLPPAGRSDWYAASAVSAFHAGRFEQVAPLVGQAAAARPGRGGEGLLDAAREVLLAMTAQFRGDLDQASKSAAEARRIVEHASVAEILGHADISAMVPWTLAQIDRFDDVLVTARRAAGVTRAAGNLFAAAPAALAEVLGLALTGRLTEAAALSEQVTVEARIARLDQPLQWALWLHAWVLAERDELARATTLAQEAHAMATRLEPSVMTTNARSVLGSTLIMAGRAEEGVPLLVAHDEPGWICRWAPRLVQGLLALGDDAAAAEHVERVRALPAADLLTSAAVGRDQAEALLLLARDEPGAALAAAQRATAEARDAGMRWEQARGLHLCGLARAADDPAGAADTLRDARTLARQCGALLLERQIGRDLRRLVRGTATPHSRTGPLNGELTAREREIAALVADGLTNRQIAARLFVSEKTVESHLSKAFGKLGVNSRAALAAQVAAP